MWFSFSINNQHISFCYVEALNMLRKTLWKYSWAWNFPRELSPHSFRTEFSEWKSLQNPEFPYWLDIIPKLNDRQKQLMLLFVQRVALNAHEYLHICASNKRTLLKYNAILIFTPKWKRFSFFGESLQLISSALMRPQWEQQKCFPIWMMYKYAAVFCYTDDLAQLFQSLSSVKFYTRRVRVWC